MARTRLLICDLDNTLYDWVAFFVPAFNSMVDLAAEILQCDRDQLLDDLKSVHQKHHDSEHPFALLETNTVDRRLSALSLDDRRRLLDPAFKAFNSTRKKHLALYPSVSETLTALKNDDVRLVAHSESRVYNVMFRLKFLGIAHFFEKIYCLERPLTTMANEDRARSFWNEFPTEKIVELQHHQRKPNPDVLLEIMTDAKLDVSEAAYIGDSLAKDVFMAKRSGCKSIWAKYGTYHVSTQYRDLVRISHWTSEEIDREAKLREAAEGIEPDFVAEQSFLELLTFLNPRPSAN